MLSKMEDVVDAKTHKKIKFTDKIWNLCLSVNVSYIGNVLVSLYWKRGDEDEIYPFEEIRYFSRQLKWGRYKEKKIKMDDKENDETINFLNTSQDNFFHSPKLGSSMRTENTIKD